MPVVDDLILKLKTDLKDVQDSLKQVEKEAGAAGKKAGESFSDAFGKVTAAFAASFAFKKVFSFFSESNKKFNELETTLNGLRATANITGQSFENLTNKVKDLSTDGVMSIDQASNAMKQLVAQGMSADKAFNLLNAAKRVGQFGNVVGNTGQAVLDFVKFTQTGSAALSENLDPSLLKVIKSLGGYQAIASDATAKQEFFNVIIEKGAALNEDYESSLRGGAASAQAFEKSIDALQATIGETLSPAISEVTGWLTRLIKGFTTWFSELSQPSKIIVLVGTALSGLIPTVMALIPALKMLGAAFSLSLGPIGLIVAGIAAVTAGIVALIEANTEFVSDTAKKAGELDRLNKRIADGHKLTTKELEKQKQLHTEINAHYGQALQYVNAITNSEIERRQILSQIDLLESQSPGRVAWLLQQRELAANAPNTEFGNVQRQQFSNEIIAIQRRIDAGNRPDANSSQRDSARQAQAEMAILTRTDQPQTVAPVFSGASGGGGQENVNRFLTQLKKNLKEITSEHEKQKRIVNQTYTGEAREQRLSEMKLVFDAEREALVNSHRQAVAEYLEEEATQKQIALSGEHKAALVANENIYRAAIEREGVTERQKQKIYQTYIKQREKIDKQYIQNRQREELKSIQGTVDAANSIASGVLSIKNADSASGFFGGAGQVMSAFGPTGALMGGILSGVGGFIDTVSNIFGESEEEKRKKREAEEKFQNEQKRLLELQADYQKELVQQGRKSEKIDDDIAERQIRLLQLQSKISELNTKRAFNASDITLEEKDAQLKEQQKELREETIEVLKDRVSTRANEVGIVQDGFLLDPISDAEISRIGVEGQQEILRLRNELDALPITQLTAKKVKEYTDAIEQIKIDTENKMKLAKKEKQSVTVEDLTPQELLQVSTNIQNQFQKKQADTDAFLKAVDLVQNFISTANSNLGHATPANIQKHKNILSDALSENINISPELASVAYSYYDALNQLVSMKRNSDRGFQVMSVASAGKVARDRVAAEKIGLTTTGFDIERGSELDSYISRMIDEQISLEDLLTDIEANTKLTAENTLPELRNRNIVSVFGNYIQSAGFRSLEGLSLPDSVGSAVLQTQRTQSASDSLLSVNLEQLSIQKDMLRTLVAIANISGGTSGGMSIEQLSHMLQQLEARSL